MRIAIDWPTAGKNLALFAAIGAFMAFINPYDATRDLNYFWSFVYWTGLIVVGGITGRSGVLLAARLQQPPHWALTVFLGAATSALGVTIAIYGVEAALRQTFNIPLWYFPQLYGLVFVIAAGISGITYLFDRVQETNDIPPADQTVDPTATFLERLPVKYRTCELFAVSSEDHYLRVHTSLGEELILMRLADAVRELSGADGLQTHRSWWVARSGVADTKRENGKLTLVLKSGTEAPVSRTYAQAVKDAALGA